MGYRSVVGGRGEENGWRALTTRLMVLEVLEREIEGNEGLGGTERGEGAGGRLESAEILGAPGVD